MTPERLNELAIVLEHKARVGNMNGFQKEKLGSVLVDAAQALREYARIKPLWEALQPKPIEECQKPSGSILMEAGAQRGAGHWYSIDERFVWDTYQGDYKIQPKQYISLGAVSKLFDQDSETDK